MGPHDVGEYSDETREARGGSWQFCLVERASMEDRDSRLDQATGF